jgi:hypothetical protein
LIKSGADQIALTKDRALTNQHRSCKNGAEISAPFFYGPGWPVRRQMQEQFSAFG